MLLDEGAADVPGDALVLLACGAFHEVQAGPISCSKRARDVRATSPRGGSRSARGD